MRQNIQYWNEKTNNITLLSSVSLFLLKETNIHTISVLIYHGMRMGTRAAGAMPRRQTHMRVRDARSRCASFCTVYVGAYCIIRSAPVLFTILSYRVEARYKSKAIQTRWKLLRQIPDAYQSQINWRIQTLKLKFPVSPSSDDKRKNKNFPVLN
jgi:hypothetical protein